MVGLLMKNVNQIILNYFLLLSIKIKRNLFNEQDSRLWVQKKERSTLLLFTF